MRGKYPSGVARPCLPWHAVQANTRDAIDAAATGVAGAGAAAACAAGVATVDAVASGPALAAASAPGAPPALTAPAPPSAAASTAQAGQRTTKRNRLRGQSVMGIFAMDKNANRKRHQHYKHANEHAMTTHRTGTRPAQRQPNRRVKDVDQCGLCQPATISRPAKTVQIQFRSINTDQLGLNPCPKATQTTTSPKIHTARDAVRPSSKGLRPRPAPHRPANKTLRPRLLNRANGRKDQKIKRSTAPIRP